MPGIGAPIQAATVTHIEVHHVCNRATVHIPTVARSLAVVTIGRRLPHYPCPEFFSKISKILDAEFPLFKTESWRPNLDHQSLAYWWNP